MEPHVYSQFAQIEDTHWWFVYRQRLMDVVLADLKFGADAVGLEIGCGTGGGLNYLKKYCAKVTGMDVSDIALELARKKYPGGDFVKGDANQLLDVFTKEKFDIICIFNVLYHKWVKNDIKVLKDACAVLNPGGYLILTEPAFSFLYRNHDRHVMGQRRYTIKEIKGMLAAAGFEQICATYFNSICFVPTLFISCLERLRIIKTEEGAEVGELKMVGPVLKKIISGVMGLELLFIKLFKTMPVGVTLLTVARKPVIKHSEV